MSIRISSDTPKILTANTFSLKKPRNIRDTCESLLDFVGNLSNDLQYKYRLELFKTTQGWGLRIKLDSISWFDHLKVTRSLDQAVGKAREFVENTRLRRRAQTHFSAQLPKEPQFYCRTIGCTFRSKCKKLKSSKSKKKNCSYQSYRNEFKVKISSSFLCFGTTRHKGSIQRKKKKFHANPKVLQKKKLKRSKKKDQKTIEE